MCFKLFSIFVILILALTCSSPAWAYKYLGVLPLSAKSHFIVGSSLMKGLAQKGHEVYVISTFPQKTPIKNYHDIPLESAAEIMEDHKNNLFDTTEKSRVEKMINYHDLGIRLTDAVLGDASVQKLMKSNHTFDAVICEVFLDEALFGLSEYFKAPLIGLSTFGAITWNTDMVGSPSPPSYIPNVMLRFTDHMTLTQRVGNLALQTFDRLFLDLYYLPRQAELYRKYFPDLTRDMYEVRRNAAMVLLNTHVSLGFPRPYVPNQIEVGGMHINRQRKPLPVDLEKFINEAEHGVIYFSMGSNLRSKDIPIEKRNEILDAFNGLKQRVLWKFEDAKLEHKPDNVFISDWFPQDDVLAHDNVKLFITHGGLLSTTESIYHGKPFIGIPIFGDQFMNMAKAEDNGHGIALDYRTLNAKDITIAVHRILGNPNYVQRIKAMSERFNDQPMLPLDKAVYWVEHVVRHNGAAYLHCAGQDLSFIEYHNLDAILILYGGIAFVLLCLAYFSWLLVKLMLGEKKVQPKRKRN